MTRPVLIAVICLLFVGCSTPDPNGPMVVEYPERLGYLEVRAEGEKLQEKHPDREFRFVLKDREEAFAFYKDGMAHMLTDRNLEALSNIYPPELLAGLEGKKILDLGCGDGSFVRDLRELGLDAYGVDIYLSKDAVQEPFLTNQDLTKMSFEERTFDVLFCTYVLFKKGALYSDFFHRGIEESLRVAKPGGLIYVGPTTLEPDVVTEIMKPFQSRATHKLIPVKPGYHDGEGFQILMIKVGDTDSTKENP